MDNLETFKTWKILNMFEMCLSILSYQKVIKLSINGRLGRVERY